MDDAQILAQLQPVEYYKKWIESYYPVRPDERRCSEYRPITVQMGTISTADSSCTLRLGDTIVICGARCEVSEPSLNALTKGFMVVNVTFCSGCAPTIRTGPPTEPAQALTNSLAKLLEDFISKQEDGLLVAVEGKLVWTIHLDVMVINDSGNLFDSAWISLMATLKNLKVPSVRMDEESGMIYHDPQNSNAFALPNDIPVPLTFAYLEERNSLVADPNEKEEFVFTNRIAHLLVGGSESSDICYIESSNVPITLLEESIPEYSDHLKHISSLISSPQ